MKENEQSRFIRWGVPGWMMLLAFLYYSIIDILLSSDSKSNKLFSFIMGLGTNSILTTSALGAVVALLVAASGIPLGFFIYQIYFYIRWNSPFSRHGLMPPLIAGRLNDLERTMDGIDEADLVNNDTWRKDWISNPLYSKDHGWKWRYIENYFTEILLRIDNQFDGASLLLRYRYLLDLLHTLGASLFGIYFGYLGYLMFKVKAQDLSLTMLLFFGSLFTLILALFLDYDDKVKRDSNNTSFNYSSIFYIVFCGTFLYLGSPSPYLGQNYGAHLDDRIAFLLIPMIAWGISKRKAPKKTLILDYFIFILIIVAALLIAQYIRLSITDFDWSFGWSTFVFLLTNMVFLKNRQNTRDDLIAMQNYTIKRYLSVERLVKEKRKASKK